MHSKKLGRAEQETRTGEQGTRTGRARNLDGQSKELGDGQSKELGDGQSKELGQAEQEARTCRAVVIYRQKQPRNSHKRALGGRPIK